MIFLVARLELDFCLLGYIIDETNYCVMAELHNNLIVFIVILRNKIGAKRIILLTKNKLNKNRNIYQMIFSNQEKYHVQFNQNSTKL